MICFCPLTSLRWSPGGITCVLLLHLFLFLLVLLLVFSHRWAAAAAAFGSAWLGGGALRGWSPVRPGLGGSGGGFDGRLYGSGSGSVGGAVLQQSATIWPIRSDSKTLQEHCRRTCRERENGFIF